MTRADEHVAMMRADSVLGVALRVRLPTLAGRSTDERCARVSCPRSASHSQQLLLSLVHGESSSQQSFSSVLWRDNAFDFMGYSAPCRAVNDSPSNQMNAALRELGASTPEEQAEAARIAARIEQAIGRDADEEEKWLEDAPLRQLIGNERTPVIANPVEATTQLQESGLVRINGCVSQTTIAALLEHMDMKLIEARANLAAATNDHQATKYFGNVRRPVNRTDLKLELLPPVAAALAEALAPLRAVCQAILGEDAELFELGTFISQPNAPRQGVHPDTKFTPDACACSTVIALQDIDETMGPTEFLPGTHCETANTALETRMKRAAEPTPAQLAAKQRAAALAAIFQNPAYKKPTEGQPSAPAHAPAMGVRERLLRNSPRQLATLRLGDAVMFDTRVLHCGGANDSPRRRVLLYFSFRVPGANTPYGRGSLDEELQLLRI